MPPLFAAATQHRVSLELRRGAWASMAALVAVGRVGVNSRRGALRLRVLPLCASLLAVTLLGCTPQRGTVGARFGRDPDGHLYVRDVPKGLGAAVAGLHPDDEVILIEGRDVRVMSEIQIHEILSGERGTSVRLTVLRGDAVLRLNVARTPPPAPRASK